MAIVTWMVESSENFLNNISETTFGSLIGAAGAVGALMSTLAIILVAANASLQYRSVDARTSILLIFKLTLVSIFALNWTQFNLVTNAIESGIQTIAGQIIGSIGGSPSATAADFAGRFDEFLDYQQMVSNTAIERMNWVGGGVWGVVASFLLGVTAALAGAVIVFAKIMLTLYVGIAPVMIIMTIFKATSDYFENWLSGLISYMLYPLIMAAVFSVVFGMTDEIIDRMTNIAAVTSLGQLLPFIVMVFLAIIGILLVPMIVRQISGNITLASPMAAPMAAVGIMAAAKTAGVSAVATGATTAAVRTTTQGASAAAGAMARLARSNRIQGSP